MHIKAADKTFDAKAETILRLFADRDLGVELGRPAAQSFGDGMGEPAFRRRREPEQTRGREALLISDEVADFGMAPRQRAGLVEDDGVDFGEALHVAPALDDDAAPRRQRHRRQDGGRRRDADAGAVIDDDQ